MSSELESIDENSFDAKAAERLKFLFLAVIFFLVIGSYTLIRDLKNSIFIGLVGKDYIPIARLIVLGLFIPAILFYAKFVDRAKRYYLLSFYAIFYAVVCLIFAFFVGHPTIGIANTNQSSSRLFGWLFYFFVEGFSPFVLSVFWAFSNSISSPDGAKKNYGLVVAGSKVGGMLTAGFAWVLFSFTSFPIIGVISDVGKHQLLLVLTSVLLFCIPFVIKLLMTKVPGSHLRGYEAVYKVEKRRVETGKAHTGILAGLKMFIKYPYVLGIFSMIFFYEILNSILSYLRLDVAQKSTTSIAATSGFLFKWVFIMHAIGFIISFFGTSSLLKRLGTRSCVFLIPIIMGGVILCFIVSDSAVVIMIAFTIMKSVHYAFSKPVIELLYIPTLKEIKFKSKSWIDAFGSKLAKATGSSFNLIMGGMGPALILPVYSIFFAVIIGAWVISSFFLGKRFDEAVSSNEVIGEL